jgi:ribosome-associated translation inhibitor RaiA
MSSTNPVSVQYKNIEPTQKLESFIVKKAAKLKKRHPAILNCQLILNKSTSSRNKGNQVQTQVSIGVPGKMIVLAKQNSGVDELSSAFASVTSAFDSAERSVDRYFERTHTEKNKLLRVKHLNLAV